VLVAGFAVLLAFGPGIGISTLGFLGSACMLGLGNGAVSSWWPCTFRGKQVS
jgi:hypothetical protein